MTNGNFAEGVAILVRYGDRGGYTLGSNHDEVFFGGDVRVSEDDAAELMELGWRWDTGRESWGCFK